MKGLAAYNRTRVESAPPEQLLVMLLEKALEKEALARAALGQGDRVRANGALHHTRAIFIELLSALDHGEAPEVTGPLANTYQWCVRQLSLVGLEGNLDRLAKVEGCNVDQPRNLAKSVTVE